MKNEQEHRTYSKANPHTAPKPVTPRLCLIILGHRAILLPPRRRAKSKWGRAAVAGVGDPGWVGWWHHPRCGEINGMNFALVSTVNAKILGIHSDNTVFRVDLAHSDQTQICQVRFPIFVSCCQGSQLREMIVTVK